MRICVLVMALAVLSAGCATSSPKAPPSTKAPSTATVQGQPPINPETDRLLKATSATLAGAKSFSFKAELWEDQMVAGHKVSTTRLMTVQARRPDRLQVEARSPKRTRGWWYNGKSVTMLDRINNLYAVAEVPNSIEAMLDAMNDRFGVTLPLDDLLVGDPYASTMSVITGGAYFGKATVLGVACHHIGYSTEAVDAQIWVEDDARALPRKIVVTYKLEEAAPQFTAILSDWVLDQKIADNAFLFVPPAGSAKIEMLPATTNE